MISIGDIVMCITDQWENVDCDDIIHPKCGEIYTVDGFDIASNIYKELNPFLYISGFNYICSNGKRSSYTHTGFRKIIDYKEAMKKAIDIKVKV